MSLGYDIGDRVMQIDDKVIGEVIKFYTPTACEQQTMILCDDGRKYHAPSITFVKVSELEEEIVSKIKSRPPQLAMAADMPITQEATQPLLVPHDYRNVKVAEGMTITIDLEDLKKPLVESHYKQIGLNYGA
ncbi:MAG: hypothetical protein HDQ97_05920 [Lachnospiraceae bacterium]|nr:hypothetical protein [Lachnospiraceae bacterium]